MANLPDDAAPTPEELDETIAGDGTRPEIVEEVPTAPEADPDADEELIQEDLDETVAGDGTRPQTAGEVPTAPEADHDGDLAAGAAAAAARIAEQEAIEAIAAAGHAARDALYAEERARTAERESQFGAGTTGETDTDGGETFYDRYRRALKLDAKTAEFLTHLYLKRRLDYQIKWYSQRIKEYDKNSFFLFRAGALVMAFSTFLAAINTAISSAELNILIAVLPALAALISGFRQLYNWDRQASLYRDTIFGLEESRLLLPDLDQLTPDKALQIYPEFVASAEDVFKDEVDQWGKIARGKTKQGEDIDRIKEFAKQFNLDVFDETGKVDETKLGAIADVVRAAGGGPGSPQSQRIRVDYPQIEQTRSGDTPLNPNEDVIDGTYDEESPAG